MGICFEGSVPACRRSRSRQRLLPLALALRCCSSGPGRQGAPRRNAPGGPTSLGPRVLLLQVLQVLQVPPGGVMKRRGRLRAVHKATTYCRGI